MITYSFTSQLNQSDKIPISTINEKRKRVLLGIFFLIVLLHSLLIFYFYSGSKIIITALGFSLLASIFLYRKNYLLLSSASIKGDSLILKNVKNQNSVTSLRSIRKLKTQRIGGMIFTFVHYKLDGSNRRALLVSGPENKLQPIVALRSAQRHYKNKRQIYKPGSVS